MIWRVLQMRGIQKPACFHMRKALIAKREKDSKIARCNTDPRKNVMIIVTRYSQ